MYLSFLFRYSQFGQQYPLSYATILMEINFSKYEGAGNDFIAIDMTSSDLDVTSEQLKSMCNRKTGIGADGVLVVQYSNMPGCKFKLMYHNADGNEGSLCGNGSRCSLAFAERNGLLDFREKTHLIAFEACDGIHTGGKVSADVYFVHIKDVKLAEVRKIDGNNYFLYNGSPHHVRFVENLAQTDVCGLGKEIRWEVYGTKGTNVNFVEVNSETPGQISVRTFERGVEDETHACGTGATASAIAAFLRHQDSDGKLGECEATPTSMTRTQVLMKGGTLEVSFKMNGEIFYDICLRGPVRHVFDGKIVL